jgi:hypothetical protein
MSFLHSDGLSPIAQKNRHLASNSGGNGDIGISSLGKSATNLAWSLARSVLSGVTPV